MCVFWMGFGLSIYIKVFTCAQTTSAALRAAGDHDRKVLEVCAETVVKAVLAGSLRLLAPNYQGKDLHRDLVKGKKDGEDRQIFIYNVD